MENTNLNPRLEQPASRPQLIRIPSEAKIPQPEADEDQYASDKDGLGEGYAEVIGVSISKEQARLMSPTTPAAEKSAALDHLNSWGFFEGEDEAGQAEILRNTLQNTLVSEPEQPDLHHGGDGQNESKLGPSQQPSPWRSEPKSLHQENNSSGGLTRQTRANTVSALPDIGLKKLLSNLSFPSLPEQWTPKHRASLSSSSIRKDSSTSQKHKSRSNSLLNGMLPWPTANQFASQSRDQSPKRRISPPETAKPTGQQLPADSQDVPASRPPAQGRTPSSLRRANSDDSLLRPRLSKQTTIETIGDDITQWEHINQQVNSRGKAIRDSFQDSLPVMPNISFSSLRPDQALRTIREPFAKSMSSVFRSDSGPSTPSTRAGSPSKSSPTRPQRTRFPSLEAALEQLEGDIVVMGGYRGSVLRAASAPHRQLWVPVKVGLNIRKVDLEVGLEPEDEESMDQHIFSSGMLTHIGPIDMSRRLFKKLRHCKKVQEGKLRVHDYGYDWRLSPALLSRKLISFLEGLECNAPSTPRHLRGATLLSHSLGGLITRHAVNRRPELFAGVAYVGTPQHCVNILGPLRRGDEVLLSSKVLTAQVNFTFRTSFLLLPENGRCFLDKETKEPYDVDFFDVESWKRYAFSPCIASCLPALNQERKSIFGNLSSSIPSLLPSNTSSSNLKSMLSSYDATASAVDSTAAKIENVAQPAEGALGMRISSLPPPPSSSITIPLPAAEAYLKRTLAETVQFKKELRHDESLQAKNRYPPHALMYATSSPTVYGARVAGRDGIYRADAYDDLAFASGDGVVLARAAMLPAGYKVADGGRIRTDRGHVGMLGDLEAVGKCLLAMMRARLTGVGLPDDNEGCEAPEKEAQHAS